MLQSVGRAAMSAIFVLGGAEAIREPGTRVKQVDDVGIPLPALAVRINATAMGVAGILLALGIAPKAAAGVLLGSLTATTLVGHPFWKEETPQARSAQLTHFLKNLGLAGALLLILAEGGNERQAGDVTRSTPPVSE